MNASFLNGKKITVFGLGVQGGGVGTVKFLARHGAKKIIITDIKSKDQLKTSLEKLKGHKNIEYVFGHHRPEDFTEVDMIVKNPGVSWDNKYIKLALDKKIPVEMDSSLFFKICKRPIIGITGTKGKTTTSTMIYEILKSAGENPIKVGIGRTSVLDKLEEIKKDSIVVFELSSWRLSALGREKISPRVGVFLNIFPDHLNYYKTMEEYIADKKYIYAHQGHKDWLVFNNDDEIVRNLSLETKSQLMKVSFGENNRGYSVFFENEKIYLNNGVDTKKIISFSDLKVRGKHNIYNVMAAIGAVHTLGIDCEKIKKGVIALTGINHRLEFVRELREVRYYNDTTATVPQATISALKSFVRPIILIAGGSDKNLAFSDLAKKISEGQAKGIIFLKGEATDKLIPQIKKYLPEEEKSRRFEIVDSMEKAVEIASRRAEKGDVILLSPGAASFGLFANEFERGDKFREAVNALK